MGVMPQMASGEKTAQAQRDRADQLAIDIDRAAAHAAGDVGAHGLAAHFGQDDVLFGPHMFFQRPMISIGDRLGLGALKTVQAVPFMPGLISPRGMISTFPALGGEGGSAARTGPAAIAKPRRIAAARIFIVVRSTPVGSIVLWRGRTAFSL